MKIELEMDDDEFAELLRKTLKTLYESVCNTYKFDVLGGENAYFPFFSTDPLEEKRQLERFIDSVAAVHNYYATYEERIGCEDIGHT